MTPAPALKPERNDDTLAVAGQPTAKLPANPTTLLHRAMEATQRPAEPYGQATALWQVPAFSPGLCGGDCAIAFGAGQRDAVTFQALAQGFETFLPSERVALTRALTAMCHPGMPAGLLLEAMSLLSEVPATQWGTIAQTLAAYKAPDLRLWQIVFQGLKAMPANQRAQRAQHLQSPVLKRPYADLLVLVQAFMSVRFEASASFVASIPILLALPLEGIERNDLLHVLTHAAEPEDLAQRVFSICLKDATMVALEEGLRGTALVRLARVLGSLELINREELIVELRSCLEHADSKTVEVIVEGLDKTPAPRRTAALQEMFELFADSHRRNDGIARIFFGLHDDARTSFTEQARTLLGKKTSGDGRSDVVRALRKVAQQERTTFVTQASQLLNASTNGKARAWVIREFAKVPAAQRSAFVTLIKQICGKIINGQNRGLVVEELSQAPFAARVAIANRCTSLLGEGLPKDQLGDVIAGLGATEPSTYEALITTARRVVGESRRNYGSMIQFMAETPEPDREACAGHLLALNLSPTALQRVMYAVCVIGAEDRLAVLQVSGPLVAINQDPARVARIINAIVDDAPEDRPGHVAALLAGPADMPGTDLENVMSTARIANTRVSIEAFWDQTVRPGDISATLHTIKNFFLQRYAQSSAQVTAAEMAAAMKVRVVGGATELDNAIRTIEGDKQHGDFSDALQKNPRYTLKGEHRIGLGELAARIWEYIASYQGYETDTESVSAAKDNMRVGLLGALAQSIEKDGHRVCGVGLSQRLMLVVQGRCDGVHIDDQPSVNVLLAQWSKLFYYVELKGKPPENDAVIEDFYKRTLEHALSLYGEGTEHAEHFQRDLASFLDLTYSWAAPEAHDGGD